MDLDIGGNMKAIMDAKEITQKQLSEATGISPSHISLIQNNKRLPNVRNLIKLAKALYCTTDVLLGVNVKFKKKENEPKKYKIE